MSKYKIHIDKPLPSDQRIEQYKDFDSLYREYQVTTRFKFWQELYKKPRYFAGVAAAVALAFLVRQAVIEESTMDTQAQQAEVLSLENINTPFEETNLNTDNQSVVFLSSNGSQLTIPAEAFVDENNAPVSGEIQFRYREIQNSTKELTEDLNFNSLALIEVEASQNGKKVFLSQDKSIEVAYVTLDEDEAYDVYQLNPSERRWTQRGDDEVMVLEPSSVEIPAKPQYPLLADASVASGMRTKVVGQKPLKPFRIKAELSDFPELQILNGVNWVHASNEASTDPWKNNIIGQDWDDALVKKLDNDRYEITFTRRDEATQQNTSFRTVATPLYHEKSYDEAMQVYEHMLSQYEDAQELKQATEQEKQKIEQENQTKIARYQKELKEWEEKYGQAENKQDTPSQYRRTFKVNNLGVYSLGKTNEGSQEQK